MGIALTVQKYIEGQGATYEVATHERTTRSSETAKAGSISANSLAKGAHLSTSAAPASGGFWAGRRMLILASATIEADRADCAGPAA